MKKFISITASLLLTLSLLAGCGKSQTEKAPIQTEPSGSSTEPITEPSTNPEMTEPSTEPVPTETEEETATVFGLDLEDRALLLTQLAEEAGFTLSLAVGERCALRFGLSCGRADHVRLLAVTDPSLLAAFLLPLTYFHY